MEIIKSITSKTSYFIVQTTYPDNYLVQEWGSGLSGHLMRYKPGDGKFNDYYKFLIYPDPDKDGTYRIVVKGWPDHQVILESNRARIVTKQDSDYQRFNFNIAQSPPTETDNDAEWNFLNGLGVQKHFDFASHGYVDPSSSSRVEARLKFIPVDEAAPDPKKIQKTIKLSDNDVAPPQNNVDTNGDEWGKKLVSIEAIPAALINDDDYNTKSTQVAKSPYYYLKQEIFWSSKNLPVVTLSADNDTSIEREYYTAFSSTSFKSVKKTIGHTFDATIEVKGSRSAEAGEEGAKAKSEVGASLKLAYQYKNQTESINQSGSSSTVSLKETYKTTYPKLTPGERDIFVKHWVQVDRFTLTNSKGEVKGSWDYIYPKKVIPQRINRK